MLLLPGQFDFEGTFRGDLSGLKIKLRLFDRATCPFQNNLFGFFGQFIFGIHLFQLFQFFLGIFQRPAGALQSVFSTFFRLRSADVAEIVKVFLGDSQGSGRQSLVQFQRLFNFFLGQLLILNRQLGQFQFVLSVLDSSIKFVGFELNNVLALADLVTLVHHLFNH